MEYDALFTSSMHRLLQHMSTHRLSVPLAISWRNLYGAPPTLHVQIEGSAFKSWLDHIDDAVLSAFDVDEGSARHMHAEGDLLDGRGVRLHVVAVVDHAELVRA